MNLDKNVIFDDSLQLNRKSSVEISNKELGRKPGLSSFFFGEIPLVKSGISSRLIEHFFAPAAAGAPMIHALDSSKTQVGPTRNL